MVGVKGRSGRKPGKPYLTPALRKLLRERDPGTGELNRDLLVAALFRAAIDHDDVQAIKLIFERVDGKVPEPVEVSGPEGGAIRYAHDFDEVAYAAIFTSVVGGEGGELAAATNGHREPVDSA